MGCAKMSEPPLMTDGSTLEALIQIAFSNFFATEKKPQDPVSHRISPPKTTSSENQDTRPGAAVSSVEPASDVPQEHHLTSSASAVGLENSDLCDNDDDSSSSFSSSSSASVPVTSSHTVLQSTKISTPAVKVEEPDDIDTCSNITVKTELHANPVIVASSAGTIKSGCQVAPSDLNESSLLREAVISSANSPRIEPIHLAGSCVLPGAQRQASPPLVRYGPVASPSREAYVKRVSSQPYPSAANGAGPWQEMPRGVKSTELPDQEVPKDPQPQPPPPPKKIGRPKIDRTDTECNGCGTLTTPQWRYIDVSLLGPEAVSRPTTDKACMCNACWLRVQKRRKAMAAPATNVPNMAANPEQGTRRTGSKSSSR